MLPLALLFTFLHLSSLISDHVYYNIYQIGYSSPRKGYNSPESKVRVCRV